MQGTIRYIIMELLPRFVKSPTSDLRAQYLKFFNAVSHDILWSWEEFANQVVQFSAVRTSGGFPQLIGAGLRTCAVDENDGS